MSVRISTVGLATVGVALVSAASLGACGSARGRGAAAESGGARRAAPAAAMPVAPAGSTSVSLESAVAAAPGVRPGASAALRSQPEQEQGGRPMRLEPEQQDTSRARYPKVWEVTIPAGTKLDSLRSEMDAQFAILPPKDLEDRTPLPIWFRVYLRKRNPELPTHGPYQYPRTARRLLQWMVAHPDSVER